MDGPIIEESFMSRQFIIDEVKNLTIRLTVSGDQFLTRKDIQSIYANAGVEENVDFIYKGKENKRVVCGPRGQRVL